MQQYLLLDLEKAEQMRAVWLREIRRCWRGKFRWPITLPSRYMVKKMEL